MGEWVRYKLDQRTDHILVDEAQDTNDAQWDIVRALTEEYFSGASRSRAAGTRTLFMVGDFKQAIYGFQGTDPREFDKMRSEVRERAQALADEECALRLPRPVDQRQLPFGPGGARSGRRRHPRVGFDAMGLPEIPPRHVAHHRPRRAWSSCGSRSRSTTAKRARRERRAGSTRTRRRYADKLAEQVRAWIDEAPVLDFDQAAADRRRHPHPGAQPRRARLVDRRAAVFGAACRLRGSTGCSCPSRSRCATCSRRLPSRCSRSTTSTSPTCWCRR